MSDFLTVCHTTLQEKQDQESTFPLNIRNSICQAITNIPIDYIEELFNRHESDPDNFDGRIEDNLRTLLPETTIVSNYRISNLTRFNSDFFIGDDNSLVCLEIEKNYLGDIVKCCG